MNTVAKLQQRITRDLVDGPNALSLGNAVIFAFDNNNPVLPTFTILHKGKKVTFKVRITKVEAARMNCQDFNIWGRVLAHIELEPGVFANKVFIRYNTRDRSGFVELE